MTSRCCSCGVSETFFKVFFGFGVAALGDVTADENCGRCDASGLETDARSSSADVVDVTSLQLVCSVAAAAAVSMISAATDVGSGDGDIGDAADDEKRLAALLVRLRLVSAATAAAAFADVT